MVTERSASPGWDEQPSILARLREWSAQHPLRPTDGSPPALCGFDKIPIGWAQAQDQQQRRPSPPLRAASRPAEVETSVAEAVVVALEQAAAAEDATALTAARERLYAAALETRRTTFRPVQQRLAGSSLGRRVLCEQARWLLEEARHGEAGLLACVLAAATRHLCLSDDLVTLARHPRLWGVATITLDWLGADTLDLWWARIHHAGCCDRRRLLRKIAPRLQDRPDIRRWVQLWGARSRAGDSAAGMGAQTSGGSKVDEIFVPCVAAACAVAGDLAGALDDPHLTDEMFEAACRLVRHMFGEMQEEDFETCPDGVLIFDRLIGLLLDRCHTLVQLRLVQRMRDWLEWPPDDFNPGRLTWELDDDAETAEQWRAERAAAWERRESSGWTEDVRAALTDDCNRILRRSHWPARVRAAFATYEPYDRSDPTLGHEGFVAWRVAPAVGVDLWEEALRRFERFPDDHVLASWLLETPDRQRALRMIQLAERLLPTRVQVDESADGRQPRRRITSLTFIFQGMRRHRILSAPLVVMALGMGTREQSLAMWVLELHDPRDWSHEIVAALRAASERESKPEHQQQITALLARLDASTAG